MSESFHLPVLWHLMYIRPWAYQMHFCSPQTAVLFKATARVRTMAGDTTALCAAGWLRCFILWFLGTTADVFALLYMIALLQVSNSLNGTRDTCSYIASGANPMFQPSHTAVRCAPRNVCLRTWTEQIPECFTLSQHLPPLSLGLCCFTWCGWVFSGCQLAATKHHCKQGESGFTVSMHTSRGNVPFHSRWKHKLKGEFIHSHPLLPPEGPWLVRLVGGHKQGVCYSSCTSLNKLQEDGQKRESMCGKREEG